MASLGEPPYLPPYKSKLATVVKFCFHCVAYLLYAVVLIGVAYLIIQGTIFLIGGTEGDLSKQLNACFAGIVWAVVAVIGLINLYMRADRHG